jgi:TolA-binding protein
MTRIHRVAQALLIVASLATPAIAAQQSVTQTDIQRLQDNIYLADRDVTSLRSRDAALANQLSSQLDDLRDEVIYLKVKLRKNQTLTRNEYADVRDRIEQLRTRAQGSTNTAGGFGSNNSTTANTGFGAGGSTAATTPRSTTSTRGGVEVPSGTELDVRLQNALDSGTAKVEDRFEATTLADVVIDGRTAIPAGSVMRGVVTSVDPATRTNRTAKMTVSFDQVTINGRAYPIRGTVTKAIEGEGIKGDLPAAGAGAAVGGLLGAVLGGAKGAVLGAVIGGGGTIAATEGKQVELPQGATLTVRLDSPLQLPSTAR